MTTRLARWVVVVMVVALGAGHSPGVLFAAHTWLDWLSELPRFDWSPVVEGQTLEPWDMIWVQKDGRVEIEIVRDGGEPWLDEEHDVVTRGGERTGRKRFPGNSYVVVHPSFGQEVRVTRVIGDVWASTERDRIEAFYLQHRSRQAVWGWSSADEIRRWRDMLKEEQLK